MCQCKLKYNSYNITILIYSYSVNTEVFKHLPITWEWGMVAASVVVYIILAEFYKLIKRKFFAIRK